MRWWDKQLKDFQNNKLDDERKTLIINEFREIDRFYENKWINSIFKIIDFYNEVKRNYGIDCYLNRIAPNKKRFIEHVLSMHHNKQIIENTIEKNLPNACKRYRI